MSGDDAAAIKAKTDKLTQAAMKLGEAMYKAQAAAAGGAGAAGPGGAGGPGGEGPGASGGPGADAGGAKKPDDGKVVDADYEEVDERKRNAKS